MIVSLSDINLLVHIERVSVVYYRLDMHLCCCSGRRIYSLDVWMLVLYDIAIFPKHSFVHSPDWF